MNPDELMDDITDPNKRTDDFELGGMRGTGNYTLHWPELNIRATAKYFRTSHDKEVKAEIQFNSERLTSQGHLRGGRVILTSPTSRNTFAKLLFKKDPSVEEAEWDIMMEQLCESVLTDYRAGSPEMVLTGDLEDVEVEWLIDPIIQEENPTLIFGIGSAGKSLFAQYLAVLVDAGYEHGGLKVQQKNVLYLDWETNYTELHRRVTQIRNVLALPGKSHIWYKSMTSGIADDAEALQDTITDKDIGFIVVDSLGMALMGDATAQDVVSRAFNALRGLKNNGNSVSTLIIDHPNKQETGLKALHGAVYKVTNSRHVFEVLKDQQVGATATKFALFHRKANNSGLIKEMGWQFGFADNRLASIQRITSSDISKTEMRTSQTQYDQVKNYLMSGAKTAQEIGDYMEKGMAPRLSEWVRDNKLTKVGERFALPATYDEIPYEGGAWTKI